MSKSAITAILLLLICFLFPLQAAAIDFHGIDLLGNYQLLNSFSFKVSDVCSGHSSFKQVSARADGWFAVCSLHTDVDKNYAQVYSLHFVDIYDMEGNFVQELSFVTDLDNAIELTDTALNIYFQTHIVSFDLDSEAISAYTIPTRSTIENGLLFDLEKKNFVSGEWEYSCSGGWVLYSKLTRSNADGTQVLLDYSYTNKPAFVICMGAGVVSAFIAFLIYRNLKKKSEL